VNSEPEAPATGGELPRLYTLKEVREAMQLGTEKLRQLLLAHPEVPRIGQGRGTRFTYEGYMQLLEVLRRPIPHGFEQLPDGRWCTRGEVARAQVEHRRCRKSELNQLRRQLLGKG
jgi:hypothetical protein